MKRKIINIRKICRLITTQHYAFIIFTEIVVGIALFSVMLLLFFHLTGEVGERELSVFDITISRYIYALRQPSLTSIMVLISDIGSIGMLIFSVILGVLLLIRKHKKVLIIFVFTLLIGLTLDAVLKEIVKRPRPILSPLESISSYSFPSGHAMSAFLFYSLLSYFAFHFFKSGWLRIGVCTGSIIFMILIGFSRIYLGVHYPSDVVGGYIAGFCWFVTVFIIERTLVFRSLCNQS